MVVKNSLRGRKVSFPKKKVVPIITTKQDKILVIFGLFLSKSSVVLSLFIRSDWWWESLPNCVFPPLWCWTVHLTAQHLIKKSVGGLRIFHGWWWNSKFEKGWAWRFPLPIGRIGKWTKRSCCVVTYSVLTVESIWALSNLCCLKYSVLLIITFV